MHGLGRKDGSGMNKSGQELVNVDGRYAYMVVCLLYHSPCLCLKFIMVKEFKLV